MPVSLSARLMTVTAALALGLGSALGSDTARADGAEDFVFDKAHTQILLEVDHLGFAPLTGQFLDFDGSLTIDQDAPENSAVSVTIDAASIFTAHEARDAHLRNEDFLNVEAYPEITFVSTEIRQTGESTAEIVGDLTILGETREVILDTTLNNLAPHPFNQNLTAGFSATTSFSRSDFGMTWGVPVIGDDVIVRINTEATLAADVAD